jgi:D-serine deaminase-like pyridoxal phosphate-dependent protein
VKSLNDADDGAAAEQQQAVLTRQKAAGKGKRYEGVFTFDRGKVPGYVVEAAKREAKLPMLQVDTQKAKREGHKARRV